MELNGLSIEQLMADGLPADEVAGELAKFIIHHDINTIIGQNSIAFDVPRIEYLLNRFAGISISYIRNVDTMLLAKAKLNLPSYKLNVLCDHFGIENKREHTAVSDAEATLEVYKKLL